VLSASGYIAIVALPQEGLQNNVKKLSVAGKRNRFYRNPTGVKKGRSCVYYRHEFLVSENRVAQKS
jgi:hypothetical protein